MTVDELAEAVFLLPPSEKKALIRKALARAYFEGRKAGLRLAVTRRNKMDNSVWLCRHYLPEAECKQCKIDPDASEMADLICREEMKTLTAALDTLNLAPFTFGGLLDRGAYNQIHAALMALLSRPA